MTPVFADTSALYALLDRRDDQHQAAARRFATFDPAEVQLVTSSYVLLETTALLQVRLGLEAVRQWHAAFGSLFDTVWVEAELHDRALRRLLAAGRRRVSLTDLVSFEIMQERLIDRAFAFDKHFQDEGFTALT